MKTARRKMVMRQEDIRSESIVNPKKSSGVVGHFFTAHGNVFKASRERRHVSLKQQEVSNNFSGESGRAAHYEKLKEETIVVEGGAPLV